MDRNFVNVLILGFAFTLIFTAFQTLSIIEQTLIQSIIVDNAGYHGNGFYSLAIVYAAFAGANWVAPAVIALIGSKWSMLLGSVTYVLFLVCVTVPVTAVLYLVSAVNGLGGALLWTGQGHYLTSVSDRHNVARNSAIFWALFQLSLLFGNLFVFYQFGAASHIASEIRLNVVIVLSTVCALGVGVLLFLTPSPRHASSASSSSAGEGDDAEAEAEAAASPEKALPLSSSGECGSGEDSSNVLCVPEAGGVAVESQLTSDTSGTPAAAAGGGAAAAAGGCVSLVATAKTALLDCVDLAKSRPVLLLAVTCFYTGLELSFFSGVFGTCIGNTLQLPNHKRLVGLTGTLIGVGEISASVVLSLLSRCSCRRQSSLVVAAGLVLQVSAFALCFLTLPADSSWGPTGASSYLPPRTGLALLGGWLLGAGDACFNTQLYALLGKSYRERSASAFALFKFVQSLSAALCFIVSPLITLHALLLTLSVTATLATVFFVSAELMLTRPATPATTTSATVALLSAPSSPDQSSPNTLVVEYDNANMTQPSHSLSPDDVQ